MAIPLQSDRWEPAKQRTHGTPKSRDRQSESRRSISVFASFYNPSASVVDPFPGNVQIANISPQDEVMSCYWIAPHVESTNRYQWHVQRLQSGSVYSIGYSFGLVRARPHWSEILRAFSVDLGEKIAEYFGKEPATRWETFSVRSAGYPPAFESEYRKLGRLVRTGATDQTQKQIFDFWLAYGPIAAVFLISKLDQERNVDALDAIAEVARRMDESVVPLIVEQLQKEPEPEIAETLLRALRRTNLASDAETRYSEIVALIRRYAEHNDSAVRSAAYETATKLLPYDAQLVLREAHERETDENNPHRDPTLIPTIQELWHEIGGTPGHAGS